MKRRQLLLATASLSLTGAAGLAAAQSDAAGTDPVRVDDVSVELGGTTVDIGSARLAYEDGDAVFRGEDWSASSGDRSASLAGATVVVGDVDAETYARLRDALVRGTRARSLSPLVAGLARADLDPDSPVSIEAGPIATDRGRVADEVTATGTVGGVVPDGTLAVARGAPVSELGAAEFDAVSVRRGDVGASGEAVAVEPADGELSVTADGGTAELPGRSLDLRDIDAGFRPPAGGFPAELRRAAAGLRRLAADGSLSPSAIGTTLAESGADVADAVAAVGDIRFDVAVGDVTRGGASVISDFRTTGTLSEVVPALRGGASGGELDRMVVVSHRDAENVDEPGDYDDYAFEVTGGLEKLEPNEDTDFARDQVSRRGDRTRVDGTVGTGDDRFAFSGELIEVEIPDEVRLEVRSR